VEAVDTIVCRLKDAHIADAAGFALNNANFMTTANEINYAPRSHRA